MEKKISVIIPVYNSEKYICRCIESILNQTYKNIEIICIDDGSNDNSKELILNFVNKTDNVFYFYEKNQGPSYARNNGIKHASGEYITFIDSDDSLTDEKCFEECITKINSKDIIIFDVGNKEKRIKEKNDFFSFIVINDLWATCGKIVKKECLRKLFNEKSYIGEDLRLWFDNSENIKSFEFIPNKYYNYEHNEKSIMNSKKIKKEIINYFDDLYEIIKRIKDDETYAKLLEYYADSYLYFVKFDKNQYIKTPIYFKRLEDIYIKIKENKKIKKSKKIKIYIKIKLCKVI